MCCLVLSLLPSVCDANNLAHSSHGLAHAVFLGMYLLRLDIATTTEFYNYNLDKSV
jgi:hypothetical protein